MSTDFATSPCVNYPQTHIIKETSSSAPSLDIEKFFSLSINEEATQPKQRKKIYAIVVDGLPLFISTKAEVEPQIKTSQDNPDTSSPIVLTERFDLIKERLALSITQMAELFGVTRKAVYDWYDGAEPRPTMMNRMEILIDVINSVPLEVDLRRLKAVWNIPISGKSFRTVFSDDSMDINTFRTALVEKLNELSTRMVEKTNSMQKSAVQFGEAQLTEFDRRADFG
jgi:DNA-binding transcriptional regulator YiaG